VRRSWGQGSESTTYEETSLHKVNITGSAHELDVSSGEDGLVVNVVGALDELHLVLGRSEFWAIALVVE
jgi:hypothetical protein